MNLRDLEYIVAVAAKRHFGLAAEACNVSQPALSAQVKKLEDELGLRLFERTTREVVPTAEAAFILENARIILEKAAEMRKFGRMHRDGQQPKIINLGVIPTIAPYYLPQFFKSVGRAATRAVNWQIHENKTETLLQQLRDGKLDGAILSLPVDAEGLSVRELFDEPFFLAIPAGHDYAAYKSIEPDDLQDANWLLLDDGHCMKDQMLGICHKARAGATHSFRATSLETLRHMVASGSGMTLLPAMARRANDGITYVPLKKTAYNRTIALVWRGNGLYADDFAEMSDKLAA
ncbi:MAG: LysR substrate-binding domain-containing protein [Micavibrio sp.]|nr:LysR substrate-binding domain-containing protein [Micavibrio sp.]